MLGQLQGDRLTKEAMRKALKILAAEVERPLIREPSARVSLPKDTITRWVSVLRDLSEDEFLWT